MWRAPVACRPAEEQAGAGRGLRGGRTWPAAALTAGGGAAPGRGTCGRAAAAASASLLWPAGSLAVPSPGSSPTSLPALFPLFPRFSFPHRELQNGGVGNRSREPRAGQVTRVAGGGGGAMLRPRPLASRGRLAGPARRLYPAFSVQCPAPRPSSCAGCRVSNTPDVVFSVVVGSRSQ